MDRALCEGAFLSLRNVDKAFPQSDGSRTAVLNGFCLDVKRGEILALFGPNGCGKSTLLNLSVGLATPDSGSVTFCDGPMDAISFGYAFQHYEASLFPWLTVLDNIALKLAIDSVPKRDRRERTREFVGRFGLSLPLNAHPYQLSGGQKQMVALLRTLVYRPALCVLDEPLSSLDYHNAQDIMARMSANWADCGSTVLLVSHDIEQAVFLADRVIVLGRKPARAVATLEVPFERPRTRELLESQAFFDLCNQARKAFFGEVLQ